MISDLLELGRVYREESFQLFDLFHEVVWHIGHGPYRVWSAGSWGAIVRENTPSGGFPPGT